MRVGARGANPEQRRSRRTARFATWAGARTVTARSRSCARGLSQAHGHVSRRAVSRESLSRGLRFLRGAWARRFRTRGNFVEDALARPNILGGPFGVLVLIVGKHVTGLRRRLPFSCLAVPRTKGMASIWGAMPAAMSNAWVLPVTSISLTTKPELRNLYFATQ